MVQKMDEAYLFLLVINYKDLKLLRTFSESMSYFRFGLSQLKKKIYISP